MNIYFTVIGLTQLAIILESLQLRRWTLLPLCHLSGYRIISINMTFFISFRNWLIVERNISFNFEKKNEEQFRRNIVFVKTHKTAGSTIQVMCCVSLTKKGDNLCLKLVLL